MYTSVVCRYCSLFNTKGGWIVVSGDCKVMEDKNCVSDNDPGLDYKPDMLCRFEYVGDATIVRSVYLTVCITVLLLTHTLAFGFLRALPVASIYIT